MPKIRTKAWKPSREIIEAIRMSPLRAYKIAQAAHLHPSTLSKIICGIQVVKENDERVLRVGKVVGVPADKCFEK
jgi:hypothetical protein